MSSFASFAQTNSSYIIKLCKGRARVYAPVKVNPDPSHPGICGALVGLYHHIGGPQYVGDSCVLSLLSWGMWGISLVLIQDGSDRFHKDFWVHFSTLGICGISFFVIHINRSINLGHKFKKANDLILRCQWLFVSLLCKDNLSESFWYNLWNVMTKIVLKINCGDSNPPILA